MNKIYFYQSEIDEMIVVLIDQIKDSGRSFRGVIGIANGGLHISRKVAAALNVEHQEIGISCYDGEKKQTSPIVTFPTCQNPVANQLVVDDLIDTGDTMRFFSNLYNLQDDSAIAVLFWKQGSFRKPDFYVREKPPEWIVFPWE